jgi:hypothetical protein
LAVWRIAEEECPWGEMAENYRMLYLASMQSSGDEVQSLRARIWLKLFGEQPESPPPKVSDITGE